MGTVGGDSTKSEGVGDELDVGVEEAKEAGDSAVVLLPLLVDFLSLVPQSRGLDIQLAQRIQHCTLYDQGLEEEGHGQEIHVLDQLVGLVLSEALGHLGLAMLSLLAQQILSESRNTYDEIEWSWIF